MHLYLPGNQIGTVTANLQLPGIAVVRMTAELTTECHAGATDSSNKKQRGRL